MRRPERGRFRARVDERLQELSLVAVYWMFFEGMLLVTIALSLFLMNLLFSLRVLSVPGPVLLLGTFTVIAVLTGALFSQIVIRMITRPIREMSAAAQRMAQGDFDIELHEKTVAIEVSQMAESFTEMARELAATEMLRSDFVSNVSHEMKTPVATIRGYATLLQTPGLPAERQAAFAGKILTATSRLSSLTDNILMLSRLEQEEIELEAETFQLDEQLRESLLLFEPQWNDGQRELEVALDEVAYFGSAELLAIVWQNLLGNAFKFTGPGDTIALSAHREARDAGSEVVVDIADTGIGMEPDDCRRIFEKFYQADRSHATEGSGLGLALVKQIVDLHGGSIAVTSEPGKGSTFTVRLPDSAPDE